MNTTRQAALILGLLVVLVCSWLAPMDAPAETQVDAGLTRALASFVTARGLSGILSVIQAAQVNIQPAGLGVTLSPGQLVAPVNELVKHFADLMLMACVAFGILKVLISISGYGLVSLALTVTALAWAAFHLRNLHAPAWLSRLFVLMLMLRFAVPVAMLGTDALSQKFLAKDYAAAQSAIDATKVNAENVKVPEPQSADGKWWLPKISDWVPSLPELKARYDELKLQIEQSTKHMIKLMVIFLLQTLLLPLLLMWALYTIAKVSVERPKASPAHAR